jgi:Fe-S cluster assembly scaffold protein SufB
MATKPEIRDIRGEFAFHDDIVYLHETKRGLSRATVEEISALKGEPEWMLQHRLRAFEHFEKRPMPLWTEGLDAIDFDRIIYYRKPSEREERSWDDVPEQIKQTFERLGIPEAERNFLAGVGAQYDSEVVYHSVREELSKIGIVFMGTDQALKEYPDIFRAHYGTIVPPEDNKFAALNSAVWSGGSFVYVPPGVEVPLPLQAYFRINGENTGQFERTLIVVDEGAQVHYIEGCTAPIYATDSLHAAVVEVVAKRGAKVRYTTIQNWSNDVYNLVTKRAHAYEDSTVEWIDANTGCLTGDSMVLKNNDVVPIAEIEPGDMVYSLSPEFEVTRSRVVSKWENAPRQVYDLVLGNHRQVRATDNHPFLVSRKVGRTRRVGWMPLYRIKPRDEVAIVGTVPDRGRPHSFEPLIRRKHMRNRFDAPGESSDDVMWLLGFYLGDGCMERNRVVFAIPDEDPAKPRLESILRGTLGLEPIRGAGVQLRVNSGAFADWIRQAGFSGDANTKRLPSWVFRTPHAQKRALIDGYVAADGHIRPGHRQVSVASASLELLEQVKALAISCGMNATRLSTRTRREKLSLGTREKIYTTSHLYFSNEELASPVHFVPVLTIVPAGEHVTYDIEVEGTANFIANGIFAHNSKKTVKYPSIYLRGRGATADIISVAVAGSGQHQDTGAKAIHLAPDTRSRIVSKSVSKDGGRATYRGQVKVAPGATNAVASVRCDALMLDDVSRSDTYPYIDIQEDDTTLTHEATVGTVSQDQVFYLMSRGLTENEAQNLIVQGFLEVFTKELPMEYAIEFNRLVKLEMEGAIG